MSLFTSNIYIYIVNFSVQIDYNVDEAASAEKYYSYEVEHTTLVILTSTMLICSENFNCSVNQFISVLVYGCFST